MHHDDENTYQQPLVYNDTADEDKSMVDTLQDGDTLDICDIDPKKAPEYFDSLKEYQIWGYGVGHVLNDLAAGMWF